RIWWCPTGPRSFLPIQAAGLYGESEDFGSKLSDFVISSYTPSSMTLIPRSRESSESQDGIQLLAVAQPSAEHQAYIPGTQEELDRIERLARGKISALQLEKETATVHMHFACHGVHKIGDPTESALLLAAGMLLAGYRGVIATMWSIMDEDAPQVAADVYQYLFKESRQILVVRPKHCIWLSERSRRVFFHWVPFIHVGV
ncbi:hypothetical protein DFH09DRAFT_909453, partial [Mycena vulgaris]